MTPEVQSALAEAASYRGADATSRSINILRLRIIEFINALDVDSQARSAIDLVEALEPSTRETDE